MTQDNKTAKKTSGTVLLPCRCTSTYQDAKYGKNNRVHNVGAKNSTCTVCGVKK